MRIIIIACHCVVSVVKCLPVYISIYNILSALVLFVWCGHWTGSSWRHSACMLQGLHLVYRALYAVCMLYSVEHHTSVLCTPWECTSYHQLCVQCSVIVSSSLFLFSLDVSYDFMSWHPIKLFFSKATVTVQGSWRNRSSCCRDAYSTLDRS